MLCSAPILKYPDTSKPYTLYTDASKYGWAGVLTQSHTSTVDGKEITMDHPVSYVSGLFWGSQLNWAALTKEAYAIYMSIKKSTFYLTGHEITVISDHLPLKKFLRKMTLNNMVNNWSTEIESFNINFVHISGKANILADTLSRLIDTDPDLKQQPELEGHEFGKYCFETLPKVRGSVSHEKVGGNEAEVCEIQITYDNPWKFRIVSWITTWGWQIHISTREWPENSGSLWQGKGRCVQWILLCQKWCFV